MARTVDQIKEELRAISEKTRDAYDLINGTAGRGGLDQKYKIALREKDQKLIDKLKPRWEAAQADYKKYQEQKNALTKELKTAETEAKTAKEKEAKAKSASSVYDQALRKLSDAAININGYKGTENYVAAYQSAQQAFEDGTKAGVKLAPLPPQAVPVPPLKGKEDQSTSEKTSEQQTEDYTAIKDRLANPANKQQLIDLQNILIKNWGYKGKADGVYNLTFQNKLDDIVKNRAYLPAGLQRLDFESFLKNNNQSIFSGTSGTGTGAQYQPTTNIYSANEAANTIQNTVKSLLDRDATPEEITKYTTLLQKAQSDPKNAVRQTLNKKTGVLERTGGLNAQQFVEDLIRKGSEYKGIVTKAAAKKASAEESNLAYAKNLLQQTAIANGLDLAKNFGSSADEWAKRIADGEDPTMFKKAIRDVAKTGMPDNVAKLLDQGVDLETIYAPYKNLMQSVLEIPANQVNLNDPTLRSAIGAEKPMTIYEFQNSLRKDPRWQFTANAHDTVSTAVQNVLKDFGFMG